MATVYLLTFPNGKGYVGLTRMLPRRRYAQHKWNATYRPDDARGLYTAWRKHGAPEMTVLEACPVEQLSDRERHHIAALRTQRPYGYNISTGGDGATHTSETRARISNSRKGMVFTAEHRERLRVASTGRVDSALTRQSKSKSARAAYTPELRAIRAEASRKRWADPEYKARVRAAIRKPRSSRTAPRGKPSADESSQILA